jgi:hypothetical protein
MQLVWNLHPKQINIQQARSAAFQYTLINYNDGRAELSVQHRGDRPSATPIKRFVYKNRNGAFGGAQRFENQHGYRDPAHHSPAEIVPFLRSFSARTIRLINEAQQQAQGLAPIDHDISSATDAYDELCTELLCCRIYDCYARIEIDNPWCAAHRPNTED